MYPDDPNWQSGVNRMITVFFYLSDVEEGGHTAFPYGPNEAGKYDTTPVYDYSKCDRGLLVPPKKGDAIIFYSMHAENHMTGNLDAGSLHGGCDVIRGNKWSANYWIRNKRRLD